MYENATCQININGKLSDKININRSLRQGCPMSMLLYVISAIPINHNTENDTLIKGLKTKIGNEIKILNYADDTTFMIRNRHSLYRIFDLIAAHEISTEAKVNEDKTEILMMGNWKDKPPDWAKYNTCVKDEVKILGCIFTNEKK